MLSGRIVKLLSTFTALKKRSVKALVLLLAIPLVYNACGKFNSLVPLNTVDLSTTPTASVQVNFCGPAPQPLNAAIKTLIILDHSGSNSKNYLMSPTGDGSPDPSVPLTVIPPLATDPTGITRYGSPALKNSLLNYLAQEYITQQATASSYAASSLAAPLPNKYYAIIDFTGPETAPGSLVNTPSTLPFQNAFTSNILNFYSGVYAEAGYGGAPPTTSAAVSSWSSSAAGFSPPSNAGSTDYESALLAAQTVIQDDITYSQKCALGTVGPDDRCPIPGVTTISSYIVVFMSDGSPILGIAGPGASKFTQQSCIGLGGPQNATNEVIDQGLICREFFETILGDVGNLVTIGQQVANQQYVASVNVFTSYYYYPGVAGSAYPNPNVDNSGQSLLQSMAQVGNGRFTNLTGGASLDYTTFQPPTKTIQYNLSDVFVTNVNGTYWTDGKFYKDSDGDGLPDFVESQFGTNPNVKSTNNSGIGDLVLYQLDNGVCQSGLTGGICNDTKANYFASSSPCAGISKNFASDPNGLNDCEKTILGDASGVGFPDSNGDSIPDWLEFKNFVQFQMGTAPSVNTPQSDGMSLYEKIKYSVPTSVPLTDLINLTPANYQLNSLGTNTLGQSCYMLNVTNFPQASSTDKVRVDVKWDSNVGDAAQLYEVGYKNFVNGNLNLIINDWNTGSPDQGIWKSWR